MTDLPHRTMRHQYSAQGRYWRVYLGKISYLIFEPGQQLLGFTFKAQR